MLKLVMRKIVNKKWMVLSLLIGNILLVSITCSNPMYTKAVLQRMLTRNMADYLATQNAYPGNITIRASVTAARLNVLDESEAKIGEMPAAFGVPALSRVDHLSTANLKTKPDLVRDNVKGEKLLSLGYMTDLKDHIKLVGGTMFTDAPDENGVVDVVVSERCLIEMNFLLGETINLPDVPGEGGQPLKIRIGGVFTNSSDDDLYWVRSPQAYANECFIAEPLFKKYVIGQAETAKLSVSAIWYLTLDYTAMRGDQAEHLLQTSTDYANYFASASNQSYREMFSPILTNYLQQAKKLGVTLWILQVPIFVLLAAFIFMVSRQMLDIEQNEIAVFKSRGAGKGQIISVYLTQSLVLALVGLLAGLPLGAFLCQVLGSSSAFLEFVQRKALTVEFNGTVLLFGGLAALLSVGAMVLPVFKFSGVTIVSHKQKRSRRSEKPMWQKLYLDVITLGVSLYGLYTFNSQKEILAQKVLGGAPLDPLMFLSSSLFIIGAGLVSLRVMPILVWLVFRLFKKVWSPALYASFLRVMRTRSSQGFIMVFLVLTIALGIFNAQTARTINTNKQDNLRYTIGADLALMEQWNDNSAQLAGGSGPGAAPADPSLELVYEEPDFGKYANLEGIDQIAKVLVADNVTMTVPGGTVKGIHLLGINTKTFGEVAWFRSGLLPSHLFNYLNLISQDARGVLLSSNFATTYGYKVGDTINYRNTDNVAVRGIIFGFVDYWPTYVPVKYTRDNDGVYRENPQFLIVGHLEQMQAQWGITPYQVWIKAKGSTQFMYDFAQETGTTYKIFNDASAQEVTIKNDPVFQGTNGILTVGFIVVLLLCTAGFLIYWILSIQSRTLQFGIFRAMGLSMREIGTMLINEHIFISGLSIATGVLVGELASRLYIPLIQMAYAASDQALPLLVVNAPQDSLRLLAVVGVMILICLSILAVLISRMKIAQALKLGED